MTATPPDPLATQHGSTTDPDTQAPMDEQTLRLREENRALRELLVAQAQATPPPQEPGPLRRLFWWLISAPGAALVSWRAGGTRRRAADYRQTCRLCHIDRALHAGDLRRAGAVGGFVEFTEHDRFRRHGCRSGTSPPDARSTSAHRTRAQSATTDACGDASTRSGFRSRSRFEFGFGLGRTPV